MDVNGEKAEMQEWRKEAGEGENKNGKREVEREEEKTVPKKRCPNPISDDVFEEICPLEVSESVEDSCGFSVCRPAVSLSVPVVTVVPVFSFVGGCAW